MHFFEKVDSFSNQKYCLQMYEEHNIYGNKFYGSSNMRRFVCAMAMGRKQMLINCMELEWRNESVWLSELSV